jgi:hypothetical protein
MQPNGLGATYSKHSGRAPERSGAITAINDCMETLVTQIFEQPSPLAPAINIEEIARWPCEKCGQTCIAAGKRDLSFPTGAFMGPCPSGCGAWINRGFRFVRPLTLRVFGSEEWNKLSVARLAARMQDGSM